MDIILNFIFAIIGGLIVWGVQQYYQNKRENKKSSFIKISQNEKIIDSNILYTLKPGMNIEIVKEYLGNPIKILSEDSPVFEEILIKTNSQIYCFKNALIKITSTDGKKIDSITLFPKDDSFEIGNYLGNINLKSSKLNIARVNSELISNSEHTLLVARHDSAFAFTYSLSNPLYLSITLFGKYQTDFNEYFKQKDPKLFQNKLISGICISEYDNHSYYIYEYELR